MKCVLGLDDLAPLVVFGSGFETLESVASFFGEVAFFRELLDSRSFQEAPGKVGVEDIVGAGHGYAGALVRRSP